MKAEFKRFGLEKFGRSYGMLGNRGWHRTYHRFMGTHFVDFGLFGIISFDGFGLWSKAQNERQFGAYPPLIFLYVAQSLHILVCWIE